ncbi:MAG TPA: acyl carrier protein [Tepidisphaeraceae bacterium]
MFGGAFVGVLLAALGMIGWTGWLIVSLCWHRPIAIPVFAGAAAGFAFILRRQGRIARAEVERFQWRRPTAEETFLEQVGIDPAEAAVALTARRVFAELGAIPPQSVKGGDRFYPDFERLPFYDSIDALEILFTLEKALWIKIPRSETDRLLTAVMARPSGTVTDAVREVVRIWRIAPRLERPTT